MGGNDRLLDLADVAAGQGGLITTAQARAVGVSPQQVARLVHSGVLERVIHGVHQLAGSVPDPLTELRAAWLSLDPQTQAGERLSRDDPGGVVSHRSAAALHKLGDLDADLHEFTVGGARRRSRNPDVRFHQGTPVRENWVVVDGLPTTTVAVTIADLARARTDGGHLAGVVVDALTRGVITLEDAAAALRPYAHHYGAPLGDGAALLDQFLDEKGIPETTVDLARAYTQTRQVTGSTVSDQLLQNIFQKLTDVNAAASILADAQAKEFRDVPTVTDIYKSWGVFDSQTLASAAQMAILRSGFVQPDPGITQITRQLQAQLAASAFRPTIRDTSSRNSNSNTDDEVR